ncbi:4'-phosphopantetheinyl transferase family protein [Streptomyces flavochromogenes]|uniref:4'-phosphopantetheinyl transferase family protein n=1 Tax=Streptomyces flavochromogenes TaxID=68199 RepID=UPI0004C1B792|nr:4'-phosphopantetheinyl transferase superfamily protein [Streptomyces flavochromogenes]
MIGSLLPPAARSVQSFTPRLDITLSPREEALIAGAVPKRRNEFTTVRACAHEALAALGLAPVPLLPDERGAPGWPPGIVGSMTHCAGYAAATVAHAHEIAALGIDAEPNCPLPEGMLEAITLPEERSALASLAALPASAAEPAWDRLLFSAKESVYKAWYPVTRRRLNFQEAFLEFAPDGTFTARVFVPAPPGLARMRGRWAADSSHVLTAVAVEQA